MEGNRRNTAVRWQKIGLSVLCVILALILIVMIFVTAYANYLLNMVVTRPEDETTKGADWTMPPDDTDPDFTGPSVDATDVTHDTLPLDPDVDPDQDGIVNILLIGQDRRPG